MDALTEKMVSLSVLASGLTEVRAPHSGYIVTVDVNGNEAYDGKKKAYTITREGELPVLRVPLEGVTRIIAEGTRAEVETQAYGREKITVTKTAAESDGKRYLYLSLPDSMSGEASTAIRRVLADGGADVSVTYRATQSSTLITPSAVRQDGDSSYVYVVQTQNGGLLSSTTMKVVRTPVTVLERSDKTVSVAEEFGYQQLADREDRTLSDGQAVMEYIN